MHSPFDPLHARMGATVLFVASGLVACSSKNVAAPLDDGPGSIADENPAPTSRESTAALGGQSGGEDFGNLPPPLTPCACEVPTARGRVLELGGCARVEVLETADRYLEIAVGEVLGGVLRLACVGSEALEVGDEIFFDFRPGDAQRCPERDDCWAMCAGAPPECSTRCVNETAEECADDLTRSHQTGRFLAVSVTGAVASFRFAGETRAASVEELLAPSCWQEHQRILDDYQNALESMPPVSMNGASSQAVMPDPQPLEQDPAECYRGP